MRWWRTPAGREGLAVGAATGAYGISCGALGVAAGLTVWQTMATSLLLFSGGSQFAFFGVVATGGGAVAAVGTSTLLGVRNMFYGLQLVRLLEARGWRRLVAAHLTIDESTAVAISQVDRRGQRTGFWAAGLAVFVLWNLMTLLGALLGDALGDPRAWGLDAAAAGAFVALLWPRLQGRDPLAAAALAVVLTVVVAPVTTPGVPVLVAALAALVVGLPRRRDRTQVVA
ncbi:branched-chain amino acid ABC transporter permease [Ornithinimicrobium avium]|uniref:Branched-chain amino acid ABC transporter permease n=1 Tax=Ornithinimicrobium avium TaxID=2283195 RepID=A0A345NSH0_9MICO|nr:branched-chain amino acid ABC transporter permease [Ornithinimicrobium avium]